MDEIDCIIDDERENSEALKSVCKNCAHCEDVNGSDYGFPIYACTKPSRQHMSNLKGFPFNTELACHSGKQLIDKEK